MIPHQILKFDICSFVHSEYIVSATRGAAGCKITRIEDANTKPLGCSTNGICIQNECDISGQCDVAVFEFIGDICIRRCWIGSADMNRQIVIGNIATFNVVNDELEESTGCRLIARWIVCTIRCDVGIISCK